MAITDGTQIHEEPIGGGLIGPTKHFFATLAAGVAKTVNFGKYKLSDLEHCFMLFSEADNANSTTFLGVPDTTAEINAAGTALTLEDAAGGSVAVMVVGTWTYK